MKYLITLLLLFISISSKADDTPRTDSLWVNKSTSNSNATYYHWYGDCEFVTETTPVRATKEAIKNRFPCKQCAKRVALYLLLQDEKWKEQKKTTERCTTSEE